MSKLIEKIKENAAITLIMFMLGTGGTFLYNAGMEIWHLPETVGELKAAHIRDSTIAFKYIHKFDSLSSVVTDHEKWLQEDFGTLKNVKAHLKIK